MNLCNFLKLILGSEIKWQMKCICSRFDFKSESPLDVRSKCHPKELLPLNGKRSSISMIRCTGDVTCFHFHICISTCYCYLNVATSVLPGDPRLQYYIVHCYGAERERESQAAPGNCYKCYQGWSAKCCKFYHGSGYSSKMRIILSLLIFTFATLTYHLMCDVKDETKSSMHDAGDARRIKMRSSLTARGVLVFKFVVS